MKKSLRKSRRLPVTERLVFASIIVISMFGCVKDKSVDAPVPEKKWVVTTIAGNGDLGFVNGPLLSASFRTPTDIAVAADGTMYITDADNERIRKIKGGQVSTFAGSDSAGSVNGNGAVAQFIYPYSIVLANDGNLYISDLNPRIRKISPAAEVSTFAGGLSQGFADGDAGSAKFYPGNSMATDEQGNIYSSDSYNCRIRKISAVGQVSTIAGNGDVGYNDGNATEAKFHFQNGIALDQQGNIYVADRGNYRIRKITKGGQVSTFAGSSFVGDEDGIGANASFRQLHDLVIDKNGNLYATDEDHIRKITPDGTVTTIAGGLTPGYQDGADTAARFRNPFGMGIDAQGNIYVADASNNRIRKISYQ